jgi:hypothetical protein
MPMYYFHLRDTDAITDVDGTDLADINAAREHADTVARELTFKTTPGRGMVEMNHSCARWRRPRTIFIRHVHCAKWQRQVIDLSLPNVAIGPKRTSVVALRMSAFGGKADIPRQIDEHARHAVADGGDGLKRLPTRSVNRRSAPGPFPASGGSPMYPRASPKGPLAAR